MGRPKKWGSNAERMRSKRTKLVKGCSNTPINEQPSRAPVVNEHSKRTGPPFEWQDIDPSKFNGHGDGVTVDGYVRVIRKVKATLDHDYGVVTEQDFIERLDYTCPHGFEGWSCKDCLKDG